MHGEAGVTPIINTFSCQIVSLVVSCVAALYNYSVAYFDYSVFLGFINWNHRRLMHNVMVVYLFG